MDQGHERNEAIVVLPVAKIPFVESEIVVSLREPVCTPDTLMFMFNRV